MYEFLNELKKYYDLCIFTASQESYAKTVLEQIDPKNKYFSFPSIRTLERKRAKQSLLFSPPA